MTSPKELSDKTKRYLDALGASDKTTKLQEIGLPTKKVEDYKYTNLENHLLENFELAKTGGDISDDVLNALPGDYRIVFINGALNSERSKLPANLTLKEVAISANAKDPIEAITLAGARSHYELTLAANQKIDDTVIVHFHTDTLESTTLPSLKINAGTSSESSFLEVFLSQGTAKTQSLARTEISLEKNAKLNHHKAVLSELPHLHVGKLVADLERDSHLYSLTFSAAGSLNRNNIEINVNGEGAHVTANGLFTARGEQHQDNFSHIHHKAAHTTSDQIFKGIIDDAGHGIFTGKIVIHRDAQQVDSSQLNKNLLLSKKAHIDTRPQIEVYADDVKCGHGATVGQINQDEVFYLESRGIPKAKAQKIICHAFGQEVIESSPVASFKKYLSEQLFNHFEKYALENLEEKLN